MVQEEWLLVYVPIGTQNNTHDTYTKIYGKLTADFYAKNPGDRSSMLTIFEGGLTGPLAAGTSSSTREGQLQSQQEWSDLMAKLKAAVISTAAARFKSFDDEVKRLESTRLSPEWSFFSFFFAKESLGLLLEQLQLPAEALKQYEELSGYCDRWQKLIPTLAPRSLMVLQPSAAPLQQLASLDFGVSEVSSKQAGRQLADGRTDTRGMRTASIKPD